MPGITMDSGRGVETPHRRGAAGHAGPGPSWCGVQVGCHGGSGVISKEAGPFEPGLAEAPRRPRREAPETPEARRGARPLLNCRGANFGNHQ